MVPEGWKEVQLHKTIEVRGGYAFSSKSFVTTGVPLVRMSDLGKGRLNTSQSAQIPANIADEFKDYQLKNQDILVGMTGSLDCFAIVTNDKTPALLNQRVACLRPNKSSQITPLYLYQLISSNIYYRKIDMIAQGGGQRNISTSDIGSIKIPLPPLPEQKKIAAILSSVDEAIEATEAVIEQTRTVKKGLLQELLTRGIGHTEFKKTAIGEIPRSWEVRAVENLADVIDPQPSHRTPPQDDNGIPYIGMGDINDDGVINFENARKVNVAVLHEHQT